MFVTRLGAMSVQIMMIIIIIIIFLIIIIIYPK